MKIGLFFNSAVIKMTSSLSTYTQGALYVQSGDSFGSFSSIWLKNICSLLYWISFRGFRRSWSNSCFLRLRSILKQLEEKDVDFEEIKKNLDFTASLLEAVYLDGTRYNTEEDSSPSFLLIKDFVAACWFMDLLQFHVGLFRGDLELFPGDVCFTGLLTSTYGPFTLTVTPFTPTFTPTINLNLHPFQLKPEMSHKDHTQPTILSFWKAFE